MLSDTQLVELEFLRDEGWTDAEIEAELGISLKPEPVKAPAESVARRKSYRERRLDERARPRPAVDAPLVTASGAPVVLPPVWADNDDAVKLAEIVDEFRDDEAHLEDLLLQEMPRAAVASCVALKGGASFSRAGLARRIAKEIATSKTGKAWWQIPMENRAGYVRLAAQFVMALEEIMAKSPVAGQAREREEGL